MEVDPELGCLELGCLELGCLELGLDLECPLTQTECVNQELEQYLWLLSMSAGHRETPLHGL